MQIFGEASLHGRNEERMSSLTIPASSMGSIFMMREAVLTIWPEEVKDNWKSPRGTKFPLMPVKVLEGE